MVPEMGNRGLWGKKCKKLKREGGGEETKRMLLGRSDLQVLALATVYMNLGFCCFFWGGCVSSLGRIMATTGVLRIS